MCKADEARCAADNAAEARVVVWETLKNYKGFPLIETDDSGEERSSVYIDLYNDRNSCGVYERGMMRFISEVQLKMEEERDSASGRLSDAMVGNPRPAYKLPPLLNDLVAVLGLNSIADLLQAPAPTACSAGSPSRRARPERRAGGPRSQRDHAAPPLPPPGARNLWCVWASGRRPAGRAPPTSRGPLPGW